MNSLTFDSKNYVKSFHHLGFVVKDLDRTIDFYVKKLGFEVFYRWSETPEQVQGGMGIPGANLDLVQLKGYGVMLEFYTYPNRPGPEVPVVPNHVGAAHAGFLVNTGNAAARDFVDLMHMIQERVYRMTGVTLEPEVRILGCSSSC